MTIQKNPDFLIIGGGVIGLAVARSLNRYFSSSSIVVLEKEESVGAHASGRNSGVLHAGFYYPVDSLKAKFTKLGNRALTQYCEEQGIPINKCGKLVVAQREADLSQMDLLIQRGRQNGIELKELDEKQAKSIEPRVRVFGNRALFSPSTATVSPKVVMASLENHLKPSVAIIKGAKFLSRTKDRQVITNKGVFTPGYVINCAGTYADHVARQFGFSKDYRILPFKGYYVYSSEAPFALKTNIYPVPDLRNPFLGVHFTLTVDGKVKIGPTAIPALWRENYLGFSRFAPKEFVEQIARQFNLFINAGFDFRSLALEALQKLSLNKMATLASSLVEDMPKDQYRTWGEPGIRAQLMNIRTKKLEMDFILEGDEQSFHVLNSVSPAFTCSFPFADYIVNKIAEIKN